MEEDAAIASLCVEVSSSVLLHYRGGKGGIKCLAFSLSGKDRVSYLSASAGHFRPKQTASVCAGILIRNERKNSK